MINFFKEWWDGLSGRERPNDYNAITYEWLKGSNANYDYNNITYLEKGFGINPDVYAVIMQMADKASSIPYILRKVKNTHRLKELQNFKNVTKGNLSIHQQIKEIKLKKDAFEEVEVPFPLESPNPLQSWAEIIKIDKIYLRTTGNAYWFVVSPKEGVNKGVPQLVYSLPAHLIKIVLKKDADLLYDENPISHYMLIHGNSYIEFNAEDVIHFKYPNPFWDLQGTHLYGLSPLKSLLRNIESSNDALDQNVKTMKNSGVFGFLHSKSTPFTAEQAVQIKEKLVEMDSNPQRLSKIAGTSADIAFTRISLTTDELRPHDFLKYDQKQICNVLNWSDKLLNNDEGAKYDNMKTALKMVVINNIIPDFKIIEENLNKHFIPRFRGYEDCVIEWDVSELPEMQDDMVSLFDWASKAMLTIDEIRALAKYPPLNTPESSQVWVSSGMQPIDEASLTAQEFDKAMRDDK